MMLAELREEVLKDVCALHGRDKCCVVCGMSCGFFQAEDGIRDLVRSRGLGDVYKRQAYPEGSHYPIGRLWHLVFLDLVCMA